MKLEIDFDKFRTMPDVYRPLVLMLMQALPEYDRRLILAELRAIEDVDVEAVVDEVVAEEAFKRDVAYVIKDAQATTKAPEGAPSSTNVVRGEPGEGTLTKDLPLDEGRVSVGDDVAPPFDSGPAAPKDVPMITTVVTPGSGLVLLGPGEEVRALQDGGVEIKKHDAPVEMYGPTTPLTDLAPSQLQARTVNALTKAGYVTLGDLAPKTVKVLAGGVDGFSASGKGADQLTSLMEAAGLWPHHWAATAEPPKAEPERPDTNTNCEFCGAAWDEAHEDDCVQIGGAPKLTEDDVVVDLGQARVTMAAEAVAVGNGKEPAMTLADVVVPTLAGLPGMEPVVDAMLDAMTTKELSMHAVKHIGSKRTAALLTAQGVTKVDALTPEEAVAYRASLMAALAEGAS